MWRLATEDDVGKMVCFSDFENLHQGNLVHNGNLRAIIDDGGEFKFASVGSIWKYAYIKEPDYRTPTTADIGKMVEVKDDGDRDWVVSRRLFGIFEGRFMAGRDDYDSCYFWDQARIKD